MDIAKTSAFTFLVSLALCGAVAAPCDGDALYARNKALSREVAELRARVNGLENDCARLAKTARVLDTTCDLMTGRLSAPPEIREKAEIVCRFETDTALEIDNTATGKRSVTNRWLADVKSGTKYRFSCEMKSDGVTGGNGVKFGAFVPVEGGKTQWPSASVGTSRFDWRRISFDYVMPVGARFCLLYGLESGTGKVLVRNVTVEAISE